MRKLYDKTYVKPAGYRKNGSLGISVTYGTPPDMAVITEIPKETSCPLDTAKHENVL